MAKGRSRPDEALAALSSPDFDHRLTAAGEKLKSVLVVTVKIPDDTLYVHYCVRDPQKGLGRTGLGQQALPIDCSNSLAAGDEHACESCGCTPFSPR
jgi:hypothetical protein